MNFSQYQIINWLEDLIPEINRTKDPESSILKFASANNLPPAVMEKLAHVFNTAKTLNYLNKTTENRGASFSLVDIEDLKSKYTNADTINKAASVKEINLSKDVYNFPDVMGVTEDSYFDDEDLGSSTDSKFVNIKKAYYDYSISKLNLEQLDQIIFDSEEDLREDLYKLASIFRKSDIEFDFEDFEKRARALYDNIDEKLDKVANFLESSKLRIKRASEAGDYAIVKDYAGELELFEKISNTIDFIKAGKELLKEAEDEYLTEGERAQKEMEKQIQQRSKGKSTDKDKKFPFGHPPDDEKEHPSWAINKAIKTPKQININTTTSTKEEKPSGPSGPSSTVSISQQIANMFNPVTGGLISGQPNWYGEQLKELFGTGFNKKQLDIDNAIADTKSNIAFNTLLLTDPVLAEADEEQLRDYYETISRVAPEVSRDINVLRSLLRNFISFESIDHPTIKDLAITEKSLADTREMQRREQRELYGPKGLSREKKGN